MSMIPADETTALLSGLVRIPSVNPLLDPKEGTGEAEIAAFARAWLREHGVDARLEKAAEERSNVTAAVGSDDGPTLVMCAHLDTVSAGNMTIPPFEPRVEEGRLYGRGSYDMKGGAAAVMAAAAALADEDLNGRVLIALVVDEEYASAGAAAFVAQHRADACIVTEPSELRLVLAHKGFVWFEVETRGRAAHGSRWDEGESAIGRMAPVIDALDEFDRGTLRGRRHHLTGPASLHCAVIEGGSGWSTYAERCVLRVERRTIPGEDADNVTGELQKVVASIDGTARIRKVFERKPSTCPRDEPVAQAVRAAAGAVLGSVPPDAGVAYWMDAAIFNEAGIPTVNIGPSGAGAHAAEEWVDVNSVLTCAEILVESAHRFVHSHGP